MKTNYPALLPTKNFITASCVIRQHCIYKNDDLLYQLKAPDVGTFLMDAYQHFHFQYPRFYKMDKLCQLGFIASEILLKDGFHSDRYQPEEIGVVLSNANASLDADQSYFRTVREIASPALFVYTLPNIVIGEICIKNNFKGENAFFVFKEFNATFMEWYINQLMDNGLLMACIGGWVELIGEEYKAALFMVEKEKREGSAIFTAETINVLCT